MIPYLVQLAVIGFLWVTLHCVGMCGPIVAGLVTADVDSGENHRARESAFRVLAYQSGRALTYALLGAGAGAVGASINHIVRGVGEVAALGMGLVLVGAGLTHALGGLHTTSSASQIGGFGLKLGRIARTIARLVPAPGLWRFALFGAVMGFLPCMLMFWVLGLAASTGSPLAGAGLLVGLVAMTTPVLLAAGTTPALAGGWLRRHGTWVVAAALLISGLWLGLIGAAANGWIAHASIEFGAGAQTFKLMFW